MSLFRSSVRPPAILSDEAVARYVEGMRAHVEPDPAFRRRLRGIVLNQYVAAREASLARVAPRAMGRLGRAVLYASFALGVGVTGVMAASDVAVPGDAFYPLKRAIEDARIDVLPASFHDELIRYELNERLAELSALVDRRDDARVDAFAAEVANEYAAVFVGVTPDVVTVVPPAHGLAALLPQLPETARVALHRAVNAAPPHHRGRAEPSAGRPSETPEPAATPDPPSGDTANEAGGSGNRESGNGRGAGGRAGGDAPAGPGSGKSAPGGSGAGGWGAGGSGAGGSGVGRAGDGHAEPLQASPAAGGSPRASQPLRSPPPTPETTPRPKASVDPRP